MASTSGRRVIVPLTNRSGGSVALGDVVVIGDGTNDSCFTTTTTASFNARHAGVAQETIASLAVGRVLVRGYTSIINTNASVTRDHFLFTHTVAKEATGSATRAAGAFGQVLATGADPAALIWGMPDATVSASASNLQSARFIRTTGDYTTTSTTWADVDATNFAFTFTTGARRVLIGFVGSGYHSLATGHVAMTVSVDAVDQGDATDGILLVSQHATAAESMNLSFTYLTDTLTAASHTFKLRWHILTAGTGTLNGTAPECEFYAVELYA